MRRLKKHMLICVQRHAAAGTMPALAAERKSSMRISKKPLPFIALLAFLVSVCCLPALAGLPPKKTPEEPRFVLVPSGEGYGIAGYTGGVTCPPRLQ